MNEETKQEPTVITHLNLGTPYFANFELVNLISGNKMLFIRKEDYKMTGETDRHYILECISS